MKWSNILLYCGLAVLLAGAIMSVLKLQPYSDYVLVAGAEGAKTALKLVTSVCAVYGHSCE